MSELPREIKPVSGHQESKLNTKIDFLNIPPEKAEERTFFDALKDSRAVVDDIANIFKDFKDRCFVYKTYVEQYEERPARFDEKESLVGMAQELEAFGDEIYKYRSSEEGIAFEAFQFQVYAIADLLRRVIGELDNPPKEVNGMIAWDAENILNWARAVKIGDIITSKSGTHRVVSKVEGRGMDAMIYFMRAGVPDVYNPTVRNFMRRAGAVKSVERKQK